MRPHNTQRVSRRGDARRSPGTRPIGDYLSLPLMLAVVPTLGCLGGWLLDRKLGTSPWFTLSLLAVGFLVGARELWVFVRHGETKERRSF